MAVQTRLGMPLDEFIREYEKEPFELINGERIPIVPPVAEHGEIIRLLVLLLARLEGIIFYTDLPFVEEDKPDWVKSSRVPDLMLFLANRWQQYTTTTPDWKRKPFVLIPDLCVEVISPNDSYGDLDEKVDEYRANGVRVTWVINPRNQTIKVYKAGSNEVIRLTAKDTLIGGDVLPGFSVPVADIFPK